MSNQINYKLLPKLVASERSLWIKTGTKYKKKIEGMDTIIHALHQSSEAKTNCLECANCCRTLGPRLTDKDVERMAKALRIKGSELMEKHLRVDEDGDIVFKTMPCPFLGNDNYCSIYEQRPKACREYPHTDRKKFYQIYKLSILNAETCPIVFDVINKLNKQLNAIK